MRAATDVTYADFSISGVVGMSEQSLLRDVMKSYPVVGGIQLHGQWMEDGDRGCASFAFSGNVSLQRGAIDLLWTAGSIGERRKSDQSVFLVTSALLAPLENGALLRLVRRCLSLINGRCTSYGHRNHYRFSRVRDD